MSQAFREHPGAVRQPVLQPGGRRRGLRHDRRDPRPPGDLQGEDPRAEGEDQVGDVLPDLGDRGRDHRRLGDHGLRHSGVQGGVHELRRRPARADADRDGHLGLLRELLVRHVRDRRRRDLRVHHAVQAIDGVPLRLRPAGAQVADPRRDPAQGDDRALDADAVDDVRRRRAARRVARRRRGRVGQRALCRRHPQDPDRRQRPAPA